MKKNDKIRKDASAISEVPVGAEVSESNAPKKKRRFTRKSLIKVMFIISIIFIMISLTYSWFTVADQARAKVKVNVADPNNLVAGGLTSKGMIDSIAGNGTSFFKPLWAEQKVGDSDGFNLYRPVKSGEYEPTQDEVIATESVADNVLIMDFNLSINGKHNVYLVNGSGVKPVGEGAEFLEGAIRVAVLKLNEETQEYELCLVWLPDVTSKKGSEGELDSEFTVVYPDGDAVKEEKIEITSEHGTKTVNNVRYAWGQIDVNNQNKVLVGELEGTEYFRCVVWLDGNDRECDYELLDKEVVATLMFLPEAISDGADE
jgi:hypothetical protein